MACSPVRLAIGALGLLLLAGCGPLHSGATDSGFVGSGDGGCAALEQQIAAQLDLSAADPNLNTAPDFTLLLESEDGRRFTYSRGNSSADTRYDSASTSKWISAVVILDLVDQGLLTLDSKPSELISYWTGESAVTLRHLLAFTSGFIEEPSCLKLGIGTSNFEQCVRNVYDGNIGTAAAPGTQFYYSSAHLQIAGQMALIASGATSWTAVFDAFKARTGLFPTSVYNLPSTSNPRLAGGMTWTGAEYLDFLRALFKGTLLSPTLRAELLANQRGSASVAKSPCLEGLGEDWAYGLGNWLECASAKQADSFDCGAGHRNSSPGAYGAYPFIDFDDRYFGILARKGALGTHPEGVRLFRSVQDLAGRWARGACGP